MPAAGTHRNLGRTVAIVATALAAALLVLLTQAPASLLAIAVASWSQGRVELGNTTGSVWQGQAAIVLTPGNPANAARTRLPGELAWRIRPWQLLLGTLDLTLSDAAVLDAPLSLRIDRRSQWHSRGRSPAPAGAGARRVRRALEHDRTRWRTRPWVGIRCTSLRGRSTARCAVTCTALRAEWIERLQPAEPDCALSATIGPWPKASSPAPRSAWKRYPDPWR